MIHETCKRTNSGISTAAIIEQVDGGESEDDVAEQLGLTLEVVRWAVVYETSRAAPLAA